VTSRVMVELQRLPSGSTYVATKLRVKAIYAHFRPERAARGRAPLRGESHQVASTNWALRWVV